jgi:hypothetical protein
MRPTLLDLVADGSDITSAGGGAENNENLFENYRGV